MLAIIINNRTNNSSNSIKSRYKYAIGIVL